MLCGLGGCSVEGKQWGWVQMVIGQYRWCVEWMGVAMGGVLNRAFFIRQKKRSRGKKDNNHNPRHERKHLKPFLSSLKIKFSRTNRKRIVHHW